MKNLDLYAKVEPLLGIEEATQTLHTYYLQQIEEYQPQTLLDVGCGDGSFLAAVKKMGIVGAGIDLSQTMVDKAKAKGLSVACQDIKDAIGAYDVITSVFDVLNFLNEDALKTFLSHVSRLLKPGGHFLADINTLYGFSEVAEGVLAYDDESQSLIVDASFDENELHTSFVYFEKDGECYKKSAATITQYYHEVIKIVSATSLELELELSIALYADESDKSILCFKKNK